MKVIIVGAGVVGLSTAWALAREGIEVTVLEKGDIPNPLSASFDQHRIIRHAYPGQDGYLKLVDQAFDAWDLLWSDLRETHYAETGVLGIRREEGDWTDEFKQQFETLAIEHEIWSANEIRERHPLFEIEDDALGVYKKEGGCLYADRIVKGLARWLRDRGMSLRERCEVSEIDFDSSSIGLASGETLAADFIVQATGAWTPCLLADAQVVTPMRQLVVYLKPPEDLQSLWENAPTLVDMGGPQDLWGLPPVDGTSLKFGLGSYKRAGNPDTDRDIPADEPEMVFTKFAFLLKRANEYQIEQAKVCYYGWKDDYVFYTKTHKNGAAISGCSGHMFKFGALMGQALSALAQKHISDTEFNRLVKAEDGHLELPS